MKNLATNREIAVSELVQTPAPCAREQGEGWGAGWQFCHHPQRTVTRSERLDRLPATSSGCVKAEISPETPWLRPVDWLHFATQGSDRAGNLATISAHCHTVGGVRSPSGDLVGVGRSGNLAKTLWLRGCILPPRIGILPPKDRTGNLASPSQRTATWPEGLDRLPATSSGWVETEISPATPSGLVTFCHSARIGLAKFATVSGPE